MADRCHISRGVPSLFAARVNTGLKVYDTMKAFRAPTKWLADVSADSAATLIAAAADIALIIDQKGLICDIAFQSENFAAEFVQAESWLGKAWRTTVTVESRQKIDALVAAANDDQPVGAQSSQARHVNYTGARGIDIPILFSRVALGRDGESIAFGRDLRPLAALQQRLVDVQQSLERDYARLRQIETRYRILFQMSTEPVLILDAATRRVSEANAAAQKLFGGGERLVGAIFGDLLDSSSDQAFSGLLSTLRAGGRTEDVRVNLARGETTDALHVVGFLFRQGDQQSVLLRLTSVNALDPRHLLSDSKAKLLKLIESAPDGFVVTGADGRVMSANAAFLDMAQIATEEQALGESLDRWLGRPGVDLGVLMANLREHGSIRLYPTALRDAFGGETDVEISAVNVANADKPSFGFAIRNVSRRPAQELLPPAGSRALPRSLEQIGELIGRLSLKDIVRETTEVIEKLSIEAALNLTGDNRASAAEVLGLSRQSLYVKLRRYGMMGADPLGAD